MIISNESMNFKDPKESDDPQVFDDPQLFDDPQPYNDLQLFDDQLEVWTLIIQKSTVIHPSLMVLFSKTETTATQIRSNKFARCLQKKKSLIRLANSCTRGRDHAKGRHFSAIHDLFSILNDLR